MGITHTAILDAESFGSRHQEEEIHCSRCGNSVKFDSEDNDWDNFGRIFCCDLCRRRFYGR